jgi:hypothetical protein
MTLAGHLIGPLQRPHVAVTSLLRRSCALHRPHVAIIAGAPFEDATARFCSRLRQNSIYISMTLAGHHRGSPQRSQVAVTYLLRLSCALHRITRRHHRGGVP